MLRFVLAALAVTSVASAQAPNIRVAGRMQLQYRASGGDSSSRFDPLAVDQSFLMRRLRIQADVRFGENILLVIAPSFEMGALRMRDAYLRVGLAPRFNLTMGQEKSPFMRYELTSSNTLPSIERGVSISGLSLQEEAMDNLLVGNGYASHDLGAFLDFAAPGDRFTIKAGVQGGSRESGRDVNNAKSFYARATAIAAKNADDQPVLQLGASFAARDRAVCRTFTGTVGPFTCTAFWADSSKMTTALGFDLEWGGFRPGPHVIADFAIGDNVPVTLRYQGAPLNTANVLNTADSNIVRFTALHVVGAWRVMVGSETSVVRILEPALRVDRTDANTNTGDNSYLVTPSLSVYFTNTVVVRMGFDYFSYLVSGERFSAQQFIMSWQANF